MNQSYGRDGPSRPARARRIVTGVLIAMLIVTGVVVLSLPILMEPGRRRVSIIQGTVAARSVAWLEPSRNRAQVVAPEVDPGDAEESLEGSVINVADYLGEGSSGYIEIVGDVPAVAGRGPAGPRDHASVREKIRAYRPAIQQCYERRMRTRGSVEGVLTVEFSVTAAGAVSDMQLLSEAGLDDQALSRCVRSRLSGVSLGRGPSERYSVPLRFVASAD